jgi:hypothetical protein
MTTHALPSQQHGEAIRLCSDYRLMKRHGIHIKIAQLLVRGWIDGYVDQAWAMVIEGSSQSRQ